MPVNLSPPESLLPVAGVRLGVAEAAIKKPGRKDLLLIALAPGTTVAGMFTRNAFCAAPVTVCRETLAAGRTIRGLLINSGCANAGTGAAGLRAARETAAAAAQLLGGAVLPFSTGVIGAALPVSRIIGALPAAQQALDEDAWLPAAKAIMTTDTVAKGASRQIEVDGHRVTVTGIAKGAGMIRPDMATMLAFIATDAALSAAASDYCLRAAVDASFNCITVDGDTSTNDAAVLCASGAAGHTTVDLDDPRLPAIAAAIAEVCLHLAQAIVRDGEGATRFIAIEVSGARDRSEARQVADAVAHSPLVKTACFAGDANWGRILAAVGRSGVEALDLSAVDIRIDDVALIAGGEPHPDYTEARGAAVFAQPEYRIGISLGRGSAGVTVWTCDLSYDYVRINAEYRS